MASRLGWLHIALAVFVLAVYWIGSVYALGQTAGQELARALTGRGPGGPLVRALWPSLLAVTVAALIGGAFIPTSTPRAPVVASATGQNSYNTSTASAPGGQVVIDTARTQATAINNLLDSSSRSKADLALALGSVCGNTSFALIMLRQVEDSRATQLNQARQLAIGSLPNGGLIQANLVEAITQSLNADRAYLAWAEHVAVDGCLTDDNRRSGDRYSSAAQKAKKAFLSLWNPVASQYNLPTRTSEHI